MTPRKRTSSSRSRHQPSTSARPAGFENTDESAAVEAPDEHRPTDGADPTETLDQPETLDPADDDGSLEESDGANGSENTDETSADAGEQPGRQIDAPEVVGRYRLTRRIGQGSFATVWRGHDDDLDVEVAVKVLSPQWAGDDDVRQRFVTEARLMRRINDARITHVYDIGQVDDGRPYFVMDFADSGSLNDVRRTRPSPVRALRLCAETCRAIAVLHEYDIVHRDVTPGNVLLTQSRGSGIRVMIADLGVANDRAADIGLPMTAGTPGYMPPEQARGEHVDARADIYALSALCYAMLTGRAPFGARTLDDVLSRDPAARPEPIADRVDAPAMLDALLAAGLSSEPKLRPPTAGLLGEALDRIADEVAARVAGRAAAEGGVGAPDRSRVGAEVGDYDAMATMIRPAGVVVTPTPAVEAEQAEPESEPEFEPEPVSARTPDGQQGQAPDSGPDRPPTALPDRPDPEAELEATPDAAVALPLPLSRYLLLAGVGLVALTVVVLLAGLILR